MYKSFIKRMLDFIMSFVLLLLLLPILILLTVAGAIAMKGNPFFIQERPGKIKKKTGKEKIFNLIKFRTMDNRKDKDGKLLPDSVRLNNYGRFIRSTSLDELVSLVNVLKGDMSLVGPRPLLVDYLSYYTPEQRMRHNVRPGITGLAQIGGRNAISFEERFELDLEYVKNMSFFLDAYIVVKTIKTVLKREGIYMKDTNSFYNGNDKKQKEKLIIIGSGGHGRVLYDIAKLNGYKEVNFLDDNENSSAIGKVCDYVKYLRDCDFIVGIGNSRVREKIQLSLQESGAKVVSLIHPKSVIANEAEIGNGSVVMAGAVVNTNTKIGRGVILNTNSVVEHDCSVDDFSHISVGAKVCGTVEVGKRTWVGAGATVINNKKVCSDCMIGAGATVVKDIELSGTYIGVPARVLEVKTI